MATKRILVLGDSHTVGSYGITLENLLRDAGSDVTRVGVVGAAAYHYNTGKHSRLTYGRVGDFDAAIGRPYDLAIVSLGTNDVTGWSAAEAARQIRTLIDRINATTKVWVGAPSFSDTAASSYNPDYARKNLNARAQELWVELSPVYGANAIDPRNATASYVQQKDIHFGPKGGKAWAEYVFASLPKPPASQDRNKDSPRSPGGVNWGLVVGLAVVFGILAFRRK